MDDDENDDVVIPQNSQNATKSNTIIIAGDANSILPPGSVSASSSNNPKPVQMPEFDDFTFKPMSRKERFISGAKRILQSRAYLIFYVGVVIINLTLIGWMIVQALVVGKVAAPNSWFFLILEFLANLALGFEVVLHMIVMHWRFFRSKSHLFDLAVLIGSTVTMTLYIISPSLGEEVAEIVIMSIRYGAQVMRIIIFVKNQRQRAVVSDVIQLNINEDPEDFARHESTIKS